MKTNSKIRLLIADDHASVRECYAISLQLEEHIKVIATVENGKQAIEQVLALQPDLVLMDLHMPVMNGLEATKILKQKCPSSKILVLSLETEPEYVQALMKAGAIGYAVKDISLDELIKAIEIAHQGGTYLSPEASIGLFTQPKETANPVTSLLGKREIEILTLIANGLSSKQIARELHIAIGTVLKHRENIRNKLDLHSVAELTKYAIDHKLI